MTYQEALTPLPKGQTNITTVFIYDRNIDTKKKKLGDTAAAPILQRLYACLSTPFAGENEEDTRRAPQDSDSQQLNNLAYGIEPRGYMY